MALLADHLAGRQRTGADPDALAFTAPHGGPSTTPTSPACPGSGTVKDGLDGLEFHDLRLDGATGMVLDYVDLKTAQSRVVQVPEPLSPRYRSRVREVSGRYPEPRCPL